MCGFAGYLGDELTLPDGESMLRRMADTIVTRGPDDAGYWCKPEKRIGLGHRRLAVIDLSPAGHQPMHSASGRYVIAFNGEIYNHTHLRQEMQAAEVAPRWRGHSDTETLLAAFDAWGIQATIERAAGMFAFSVWDNKEDTLILGRDRIGEKPLYYGWQGNIFLFGSELKALKQHPAFTAEIDKNAVALFIRHNYIPTPYSIYHGISKLSPGCLLQVSLSRKHPKILRYWSMRDVAAHGVSNPFLGSTSEAVDILKNLAMAAVGRQMAADVPLGAFLSGGVDSSTVVALMQAQSAHPVKTFSIGFDQQDYNEAVHAMAVAKVLGTDHTELYVTSREAMEVIPSLPTLWDEPFADSSQIPTFLVSKLARQHVTVALSGDAGDELFCGYNRYRLAENFWRKMMLLPRVTRVLIAQCILAIPPALWNQIAYLMPNRFSGIRGKTHKVTQVLRCHSFDALYPILVSHTASPETWVPGSYELPTSLTEDMPDLTCLGEMQKMMFFDTVTYLVDDILVKVDRAAMGVSLETRMPFLDHNLIEFAWQLPMSMKLKNGKYKWILRQLLHRYVPKELVERPKMGFGIPLQTWLHGPLREWAGALLDENRLRQENFFNVNSVRRLWINFQKRRNVSPYLLWNILMFQAWLEQGRVNA